MGKLLPSLVPTCGIMRYLRCHPGFLDLSWCFIWHLISKMQHHKISQMSPWLLWSLMMPYLALLCGLSIFFCGFSIFLSIILASWDPKVGTIRNQWCHSFGIIGFSWCLLLGLMMLKWCLKRCLNHKMNESRISLTFFCCGRK